MPKSTIIVNFSEILTHAETLGFSWNAAHDFLADDGIPPMYETKSIEYFQSDIKNNAYGWSDDTMRVMATYFSSNQLTEFTLIND